MWSGCKRRSKDDVDDADDIGDTCDIDDPIEK